MTPLNCSFVSPDVSTLQPAAGLRPFQHETVRPHHCHTEKARQTVDARAWATIGDPLEEKTAEAGERGHRFIPQEAKNSLRREALPSYSPRQKLVRVSEVGSCTPRICMQR